MRMSEESEDDQMPEDWIDATLVCLYKGKGSRLDPKMYRGISLISSMEKIFTTVILNRIRSCVDRVIKQQQGGFRPNKSTRDVVFGLWRDMDRKWRSKEGFIVTFIDFSKAFDSLVWEALWKIMECLGCPAKLVAVVRSLYSQSTISIRLSMDGELAPSFVQKKGTRQGSGLSPCIFTMPVDFAMKVADMACEELGMIGSEDEDKRGAYADDVAERTRNEEEASVSLQQFEAGAGYGGLGLNVGKTEVMGCRIKKAVVSEEVENAMKERISVKVDGEEMWGWIVPAKWRAELGISEWSDDQSKGKMAIQFDNGEAWLVELSGSGWIKDSKEGKSWRMKKLGGLTSLDVKIERDKKMGKKRKICENCGSEFASEVGWLQHVRGGRCQKLEDMSESQLKARRATRAKTVLERKGKVFDVELVEVRSCNGGVAKACGSFLYLGSLTDKKGSSGPEIRRRIKKATETFRRLWRVWAMKGLPLKLKGRLYSAFVHSVLMYNSEVWTITETEMKALVGRNGYLMRRLVGEVVRSADDKRLTESQLLEMLGLESIQSLIRKRKLQWVAHCARRGDKDLSWKRIVREVEDGKSKWGARLKEDWKELGVNTVRGWCNKVKDRGWLASKLGTSKRKGRAKKRG